MPFETDKKNGFKFDASELLRTGVYPDTFDRNIPFWDEVNGVQYDEFGMKRKAGRSLIKDISASPTSSTSEIRGIATTNEFDTKVAYIADRNKIYSYRSSTDVTRSVVEAGTDYNLIADVSATVWDAASEFVVTSAKATQTTEVELTFGGPHGMSPGDTFSIAGLGTGSTSSVDINNGGSNPATYTFVTPVGGSLNDLKVYFNISGLTKDETFSTSGSSKLTPPRPTTWDSTETTWDISSNFPDTWVFETFGSFVVGARGQGKPVIKKNNVIFNTFFNDEVSGGTITNPGTANYAVDDVLNQASVSPSGGSNFSAKVSEVESGTVKAIEVTNFGSGYANGDVITMAIPSGSPTRSGAVTVTVTKPDINYTKVKIFKSQGPHMLAFNYSTAADDFKTSFSWCSADDLDSWVGSATNTAGNLQIREANGEIMCVTQLGNNLAVYTQNQMFIVSYIGLPNIFGYKLALEGDIGAVSPHSVVSIGRKNYGLSRDGFFVTDGASSQLIGNQSSINKFYRDNVSNNGVYLTQAFDNSKENEVVWSVPLNNNTVSKELYYNYNTGQWGMRDGSVTVYKSADVFDSALSADTSGKFYFEGEGTDLSNSFVSATTKAHDFNNADRIKEVSSLRVGKEGNGSPTVKIAFTNTIDATPDFENPVSSDQFVVKDTFESFPVRVAGRYIHLNISSEANDDTWKITDMVIQGRFEGER
tara:strand:- start:1087 stop:3198 length:2112 start_codon:yes stop_codon:yes gene_type:complete